MLELQAEGCEQVTMAKGESRVLQAEEQQVLWARGRRGQGPDTKSTEHARWNPEDRHRPRAGSEAQKEVLARGAKLIRMERMTEAQLCLQNTAKRLPTVKSC